MGRTRLGAVIKLRALPRRSEAAAGERGGGSERVGDESMMAMAMAQARI